MEKVCTECHTASRADEELRRGDAVRSQSLHLVKEAEKVLWVLDDGELLDPMPADRPPNPLAGPVLVTDGRMLYEDTSRIETLFFKMKKFDLAKTVKGAYHQNPAYTHWYGNAELKMDLVDIRSEASRLKKEMEPKAPPAVADRREETGRKLQVLKNRFDRGAITAEDYAREKAALLKESARP